MIKQGTTWRGLGQFSGWVDNVDSVPPGGDALPIEDIIVDLSSVLSISVVCMGPGEYRLAPNILGFWD